jgi:hypothetical protein
MADEKDPRLTELFGAAPRHLNDEAFMAGVMGKIAQQERRSRLVQCLALVALVAIAVLVQDGVTDLIRRLTTAVISADNDPVAQALAPFTSPAGIIALSILASRLAYRRLRS